MFDSVPARMVQFTRRSPRFSAVMQDLFAGKQPYSQLKRRLLKNLNGSLYEIGMSLGFSRLVPRKARKLTKSEAFFERAQEFIPGGVNSPVRAFRSVGGKPLFIAQGQGSRLFDVDGNEYIDYVGSWGPLLLGHRHPEIIAALEGALEIGTSFGAPTAQRDRSGGGDLRRRAVHRDGAAGEFGDGSDHVRHPAGARIHGARPDHQVRRLLSRPRGFAAGAGGQRHGDAGHRGYARRSAGVLRYDDLAAVSIP